MHDQALLTLAELQAHDPEGGKHGRWLCPFPDCAGHTDTRKHRNLDVEPEGNKSGVFFCHRCKAKGQLKDYWKDFVPESPKAKAQRVRLRRDQEEARKLDAIGQRFKARGKPLSVAALLALGASGQAPAAVVAPEVGGSSRTVHPELKEVLYRAGSLQGLDCDQARAFIALRGLAGHAEILQRARVKFSPDYMRKEATEGKRAWSGTPALVFPIADDAGQLVAFQGRLFTGLKDPKTGEEGSNKITFGPKSRGLFWGPGAREAYQRGEALAITEAPLDALTLAVCGVPAVALCGSSALPEFLSLRCFGRRFWLAFDADGPGDEAAKVIGAELARFGGIVARLRPEVKDWNAALQEGGALWDRTAAALLTLMGSEAKASPEEGEHGRSELGTMVPELSAVVGTERGELEQVGALPPHGLKHIETESPSEIEQNRTENGPALYGDQRQEVLSWALAEAKRGTLPEPSESLSLPSGQRITAGGAAVWLQEAQKRAEALSLMGSVSVDAERASLLVRQDMRALALWCADARVWLDSPATHRGAFCLLPWAGIMIDAELLALASEFEGDLPELDTPSL